MKKFIFALSFLAAFNASATELLIDNCKFAETTMDFTPSSALTALLQNEVNGSVVYKVNYKKGSFQTGPKNDLAVIDEVSNDTLVVSFFDLDGDSIHFLKPTVTINLDTPVSVDAPVIGFEAGLNDEDATEGVCELLF